MRNLKLAVIGCGHLGRIHARLAQGLAHVDLVGVADPVAAARHDVAAETGAKAHADYRELVGKIDAAILATPTSTHHAIGMDLLSHGTHLLIEKPLAMNAALADELVEMARQNGVVLQVGHVERFNPALSRALPHISDPKFIEAARTSGYPFRSTDIGVVLDLMIHDLDIVLSLVRSPVERVEALGVAVLGQSEDAAHARLTFENGCVANFTASRVSYHSQRTMQVWSPHAFAAIDFGLRNTTLVHPSEDLLRREWELDALSGAQKNHLKRHLFDELLVKKTVQGAEGNALFDEQCELVDCIREGREPRVSGEQGRDVLAVCEQILQSIEQHAWDGRADGRLGSLAMPATPILRATHWEAEPEPAAARPAKRREAG